MNFKEDFKLQSIELNEKRVIRDAIHDYIHVDHLIIWRLINSKEMQRLRRIKQLGGNLSGFSKCRTFKICPFFRCLSGCQTHVRNRVFNKYFK